MRKLQQGFTLIELVVVITILGILAAFAIPRFTALDKQARITAITSLGGSLRSASALAHAEYLAVGTNPSTILMDGQSVTLANGYPDVAGLPLTMQDLTGFTPTATTTAITYSKDGATDPTNCAVTYTVSSAVGQPATVSAPVTSGC